MRLLTRDEVLARVPVNRATLWRWGRDPRVGFPAPVRIGARVFWPEPEVDAFLARRIADRDRQAATVAGVRGEAAGAAGR